MICFVPTTAYSNPSNRRYLYASPANSSTAFLQCHKKKIPGFPLASFDRETTRRKGNWPGAEAMHFGLVAAFDSCSNHSVPAATEIFARSVRLENAPKRTKI
jgi:hypothetical protein